MRSESEAPDLTAIRVAHVSTVHRANDARIRHKECRSLVAHGATVTLIARPSPIAQSDDQITVIEVPEFANRRSRLVRAGWLAAKHVRELRPDVVHFHDPELLPFAALFRRGGAKVIYDVHEDLPKLIMARTWIRPGVRSFVSALAERAEPLLARLCQGFVLVEPDWASRFPARPTAICRNFPLRSEFGQLEPSTRSATPHFVYVGDITRERGAHLAVQAINALPGEASLTLAGPIATTELHNELMALDVNNRTTLPGLIGRDQVRALLSSATAGLVLLDSTPAYETATATKIFEYMGAGLPMILSNTTAHRRVANDHECALVVSFDAPDETTAAMQTLADDPTLTTELGNRARNAFEQLPKWEHDAASLVDLYRELLDLP